LNPLLKKNSKLPRGGKMHKEKTTDGRRILPLSRRSVVKGLAVGGAMAALDWYGSPVFGETQHRNPDTLTGTHFDLTIDYLPVNFMGRHRLATAVNGSVPGPTLRWREGDTVTLSVTNRLKTMSSIHWHAIRLPANMDGVPGLSFPGIAPNKTFTYRIPVVQCGTYWYHSHARFQEQTGLVGAIIIEPRDKDPIEFDREYIVMLTDWTDTDPETIFSNLKEQSDYYNYHQRTAGTFFSDVRKRGLGPTLSNRLMWGRMNMAPTDIADVTGATYTYLLNGNTPNANWTGLFQPGERVRLRFINGSSMTFFDVRVPGLPMTVVQADGNDIEPVTVDEFRIGVAETYDVIVQPHENAAYTIFAQSEDRSGYARGTLAPKAGMTAEVPRMDQRPMRTMADMGMGMAGMNMAGIDGMQAKDMSAMGKDGMKGMAGMDMGDSGKHSITSMDKSNTPTVGQQSMAAMDMGSATKGAMPEMGQADMTATRDHSMEGMVMGNAAGTTPFPQPGPNTMPLLGTGAVEGKLVPSHPVHLRVGPQVVQVAMNVSERLDDPGNGLKGNGRRVLTYADLRARYRGVDGRPPTREIELHLSGNMERFIWGFNGKKFSDAKPIELKLGERVRFVLINDTMMEHPIHLHGLWSELENGHGAFNPYKHTITVKPAERVSYLVSADTPGRWAYHCHLIYHMEAGMFRTVVVS
jgi:CopA family copper-resistance protein